MVSRFFQIIEKYILQRKKNLPSYLIFFVTSKCNARCQHCFNWRNLNKNKDLTLKEIKKLSKQLGEIDSLNISGGEPFLRKDLAEICGIFFNINKVKRLAIPTNGLVEKRDIYRQVEKILNYAKDSEVTIIFSFEGTEKIHEEIRRVKGGFNKTLEAMLSVAKLREKYPNLKIQVGTTVSNKNYLEIYKLIDFLNDRLVNLDVFSIGFIRGNPKEKSFRLPEICKLKRLEEYRRNKLPVSSFIGEAIERTIFDLKIKVLRKKRQLVKCVAGDFIGVVMDNGDVAPCELLPSVGNIRNNDFKTIWNSKKARHATDKISAGKCFCTHECFLFPSLLGKFDYYPLLFFNYLKVLLHL